jgi:multidrug efflux pump subunit AcrB
MLAAIPFSYIGLFLTFGIFDFYFDQGGYAAFIILGGLVVSATVHLLFDYQHSDRSNESVIKLIFAKSGLQIAGCVVICLGLTPFLAEGQNEVFWFAFAAGTIGGLLFSTIWSFVLLPVFLVRS